VGEGANELFQIRPALCELFGDVVSHRERGLARALADFVKRRSLVDEHDVGIVGRPQLGEDHPPR
jgi:hypothetical protein